MRVGKVNAVDELEDQFSGESHEPLGLPFDEEANFFTPKLMIAKVSCMRLRVYLHRRPGSRLREMGAVPY